MSLLAWIPGPVEWTIIAVVALLIFGRRLPEVARSVGKSIVEFKRGIKDVKDDIEHQSRFESPKTPTLESKPEPPPAPAESVEPPTSAPTEQPAEHSG